MLHQIRAGPRVFAPGRKALGAADDRQQNRRRHPDGRVSRQQANDGGGPGHEQNGERQCAFAADPVAQHAEKQPTQRTKRERHREHCEGLEQRHTGVAAGEELLSDSGGEKAIDCKVEPFDKIADTGRNDDFSQSGRIDLLDGWSRHKNLGARNKDPNYRYSA